MTVNSYSSYESHDGSLTELRHALKIVLCPGCGLHHLPECLKKKDRGQETYCLIVKGKYSNIMAERKQKMVWVWW